VAYPVNHRDPGGLDLLNFPQGPCGEHARSVLVGRTGELEHLDALAEAARTGRGERLIVVGDPGLGRTALLDAAHRRSARRGVRVVHLRAVLGQDVLPYSLIEDLVRVVGGAGDVATGPGGWDRALLDLLVALVLQRPALLLVDDADFADADSLRTLRTAVERLGAGSLSTVLALRPDPAILACFASWPRQDLAPLDPDASTALLRAVLGTHRSPTLAPGVVEALGGNPLGLTHAAATLTDAQLAGRVPLPDPMPLGPVAASWAPTLDHLSERARVALVDLAVSGGRPEVLGAMVESADQFTAGLDEALEAGVAHLDPEGRPTFRTVAARDALLARAPTGQVRRAHRRAGDAAAALDLPAAVVVAHLTRSVLTPDEATAGALAEQAARAEAEEHIEVAVRAWETAALMSVDPEHRVAWALAAVRLAYQLGYPVSDQVLRLCATQQLDPGIQAQAAALRAEQQLDPDPKAALPAILAALDSALVTTPESAVMLSFDAAITAWQLGEAAIGLRAARTFAGLLDRGLRDSEVSIPPWAGDAILAAGLFQAGEVAESVPLRRRAIEAARTVDPRAIDLSMLMVITMLDDLVLDLSPEAENRLLVEAERTGDSPGLTPCRYGVLGWRARARGDWSTAADYLTTGRPLAERAEQIQPWLGMTALAVELAAVRGHDEVLRVEARQLREVGARCGDRRRLATLDRALGLRAMVDGDLGQALVWLTDAADVGFLGRGLRDAVLPARVDLIEVLTRTGDLAEAAQRYAGLHRLLSDMDDPLATALDERAAALVTGGEEAEAHYHAALAAHAQAGEPFEQGRTLLLLGEHLRRNRRRTDARIALARAVHAFEALGADPWTRRAHQELRAIGGRVHSGAGTATRAEVSALTPQERAVALAAAEGRTNREIAEALFLSPRTVEYHLTNAYRKLNVHTRGALARAMLDTAARSATSPGPRW
jgi:DNA-binding CsgD family transcriptional regulator